LGVVLRENKGTAVGMLHVYSSNMGDQIVLTPKKNRMLWQAWRWLNNSWKKKNTYLKNFNIIC